MTEPNAKRRWPWVKITLVLSLALNLLIVGLVAGAIFGAKPGSGPGLRDIGLGPFFSALPREDKREITAEMKAQAGSFRENRAALREQFRAFLAAIQADPFDRAEVERLIAAQRDHIGARQALGQSLLLDRLESMTVAERAAYAEALSHALRRGARRDKR